MNPKILEIIKLIDNNPVLYNIFKSCPYEILRQCDIKNYPVGAIVCQQGEIIDSFKVIAKGLIDVYFIGENGKRYKVTTKQCGSIIGELEFFGNKPFVCSVEANSDLVLLEIKRDLFLKWVLEDRNISSYLIEVLSSKFYDYSIKAGNDVLYPLNIRICNYLLSKCGPISKKNTNVEIKINKEKLSEELAVTSRSIHRILRNLQEKNLIEVKTESIIVKDPEALTLEVDANL